MSEVSREEFERLRDELKNENERLRDRVDDLEAEKAQLQDRVDELEEQPEISMETGDLQTLEIGAVPAGKIIKAKQSKTEFELELEELKGKIEAQTQGVEQGKTTVQNHDTILEEICAWSDDVAEAELTPNQKRARHIALHLNDYARSTPKGRIIQAKDLRTVLQARFDTNHSETVSRVREFLDDLGGDLIEVKEPRTAGFSPDKKGEKKAKGKMIVVDEQLAQRLSKISHQHDHDVVTGATA